MKKILIVSALALSLAGCQTAQSIATSITTATNTVQEKAHAVQGYATTLCSFVPTIASIIAVFNSGYSSDVAVVANAICSAVTTVPLADGPGDHRPRINGVLIKGQFVK